MKKYQEFLKYEYESLELISPLEMLDCFSTQYINLTLVRKKKEDNYVPQKGEICDGVTLTKALDVEDHKKKVVSIVGGPGMGKSTLAINICKQWAEGDLLQDYDAVILLPLRDPEIQRAENIKDLLLTPDDELRENVYKEIAKSYGERICFILEGYDELPYHLQRESLFTKLTKKLPKCTLVYTSRPEAFLPFSTFKVIKINGFNDESIDKYVSKAFENLQNGEEMVHTLKSQVDDNSVVKSILHIPINVAIVCLIFSQFLTLPRTLTELYTLLCLRLILRHINTRTPNLKRVERLQSLDHLPSGISEQFSQLCYAAYKGMEGKMAIFSSQDLMKFGVDESNLRGMGLLVIASTISVAGREKSYNFIHLTLQEFCTAWYISKLSSEEQIRLASIYYHQGEGHFKMVWRFYSGITKLQNSDVINYMLPYKLVRSHISDWKVSDLAHIAYEASRSELCQIVGDYFKGDAIVDGLDQLESHVSNYVLTHFRGLLHLPKDGLKIVIDWSLQHSKDILHHSLEEIAVQYCDSIYELHLIRESQYIELISQVLSSSKTLTVLHIEQVYLDNHDLIKCLTNESLHDFKMSHCGLNPTAVDIIGEMLSHNRSIRSVDLSYNFIADVGVEKLVYHLINNNTLCYIKLCSNEITDSGANYLRKLITRDHSTLTSIELSDNPLKDKGVDSILQSLPKGTEHIGLCDTLMTELSCQSLGNALNKVKSISFDQVFDFGSISSQEESVTGNYSNTIENFISNDHSKVVTTSLLYTTTLEHLEIRLTDLASHKLINVISQNESIKTLKLHYYMETTEDSWTVELAQYIRHNKSLTKLIMTGEILRTPLHFAELLADSLTSNCSIKSMVYELISGLARCSMTLNDAYKFIIKLKENNTLDELTLNNVGLRSGEDNQFSEEVETCVQQMNKVRDTKNVATLRVSIMCTRIILGEYMPVICK